MKKKILAMALSVIMIVGMIPMSAFTAVAVESMPTRTKALDLTVQETSDNTTAEGWKWDAESKTLTLNGLNLATDATPAVSLPEGTTVILADRSENSITATADGAQAILCYGDMTMKTADGSANKGSLTIKAENGSTQGIALADPYYVEGLVFEDNAAAFSLSNVMLDITGRRGIQMLNNGTEQRYVHSMVLDGVDYTFAANENVTNYRSLQVWIQNNGDASITLKNTTLNTEGDIHCVSYGDNSESTINIIEKSNLNVTGCITAYGAKTLNMNIDNSTVTASKIKTGWWNTSTNTAQLNANNSTLILSNLNGSDAAIEVGVNHAVTAEATLKNSKIIAINNKDAALSVSRKPTQKDDETAETYEEARGSLTIENCEVFLSDRDKAGLTHLSQATIADSDITTATAPENTTVTVAVADGVMQLTLPVGTVIKSADETYTLSGDGATLSLDTTTQLLSIPAGTVLNTTNGDITSEGVMTIAPGQQVAMPDAVQVAANISSNTSEVVVGEKVYVSVNASGGEGSFNASQLEITYSDILEFNGDDSDFGTAEVTVENGVVKLVDYGKAKNYGNGIYTLAFIAKQSGDADIALISAGFGTAVSAETKNLTKADCNVISDTLTVKNNVTLDPMFEGATSVYRSDDYTFSIESVTGQHYNYTLPTATIDGVPAAVIANADGTWTVENITGELIIEGSRTAKVHNVTITETGFATGAASATYGTNYTFTLADDLDAGVESGYYYTVTSVTIGGVAYNAYTVSERSYTIPGTAITGEVVITISKTVTDPDEFRVSTSGNAVVDATLSSSVVDIYGDVTLTITPERGYVYEVSASGYTVVPNGNVYTVSNVTTAVTFEVTKTVDVTTADTGSYLTLNNSQTVNYVQIGAETPLTGKTYTYKGQEMFWSEAYKAYVTVVIGGTPTITAEDFAIVDGEATVIAKGEQDINKSGATDANDAQLVYNIYMSEYTAFTADVTVEKFLRADVNGNHKIEVADAAAIVNSILGATE